MNSFETRGSDQTLWAAKPRQCGFTLVELMITLIVSATLLALAVPSFTFTTRSNRLTTTTNEVVAALNFTRSEAVKRSQTVTIRRSGGQWENGWDVFTDVNGNGSFDVSDNDTVLRTYGPLSETFMLSADAAFATFVTYRATGVTTNTGSFVVCDNADGNGLPETNTSRMILVSTIGRVSIARDADKNGIPENAAGTEINSCTAPFAS